jgi:hypothetical protein
MHLRRLGASDVFVLGLPLLLDVICVVHAIRRGTIFPWIFVIVFLPGIGALIYIAMEIVPELVGSRGAAKVKAGITGVVDPNRDYRQALREAELVGSVDARRALAEQHLQRGQIGEGVAIYRALGQGQFRDDPVVLLGLARASFLAGDGAGAQEALDQLQATNPGYQSPDAHLLYARALEAQGKDEEARGEYERLVRYFSGEEARCRYAMLLDRVGETAAAGTVYQQVVKSLDGAPRHYRKAQKEWGDIARRNLAV